MSYKYILFDIDSTLVSFDKSFAGAARRVLELGGHEVNDEYIQEYYRYNDEMWYSLDLNHVERQYILDNYHRLYVEYLTEANRHAKERMGLKGSVEELTQCFKTQLGANAVPNPNAISVVRRLSSSHSICIATNGLTDVQPGKLTAFNQFLDKIYISQAMNCIKPQEEYFAYITRDLGAAPSECLMVGDSLANDIDGANRYGIASCYYNPEGLANNSKIKATYEIKDFNELLNFA